MFKLPFRLVVAAVAPSRHRRGCGDDSEVRFCFSPKQTFAVSPLSVFQFHAPTLDYNISIKSTDLSSEEEVKEEEEEACLIEIRSVQSVLSSLMRQSPVFPVLLVQNRPAEKASSLI